ncbi:MAG: TonB-dependent receptor [Ignavibacteriae bacterium]|nr:TonB-dependent receptor [Ignavibacteriota bacterium]
MKNIPIFLIFIFFTNLIYSQSKLEYNLDSVIVTATRVPTSFSEIGRSIEVINQKEIRQLPVSTIQDLLEHASGIDVKQRGTEGVQADISIRGGSFEQTLILIDGIKLTDPQTGHHNMNLPVVLDQVERVEILKGQGSRIHGANAFSGVINIITKKNTNNNFQLNLQGGEHSFYKLGVNSSAKLGNTNHHISFSKTKSDGYRFNTGFENYNFSINNSFNFSNSVINTLYGYADKDFGANSFYTTRFPNQAEKTRTHLAAISADIEFDNFSFTPKIYWRKNEDEFVLDKHNHSFYKNNHETNVYGGELQVTTNVLGEATSFGIEYTSDKIISNNLGEHQRERKGFFIEQKVNLVKHLNLNLGGFVFNYSNLGWKFWPGFDVAYSPTSILKLFVNFGRAFRIPTYTELYYSDPVTKGNSKLQPEESTNYELGINYIIKSVKLNASFFRREGKNLIDYIKETDELWNARNITEVNTNGFEIGALFGFEKGSFLNKIQIGYTYLNSDKIEAEQISRYTLTHLKHDLNVKLFKKLPFGISQSWTLNYENRISLEDHFTIDAKLTKTFSNLNVFIKVSNVLDEIYEEIPGVPLHGRWIVGGVKINLL